MLRVIGFPNYIRRLQAPKIMGLLDPQKKDLIIDIGCNGGFFTYEIGQKSQCVGVDLKISKSLSFAMSNRPSIIYMNADALKLPFRNEIFDKILLSSVLQMVSDDKELLSECKRLLKKNGLFVLTVPTDYGFIKELNMLRPYLIKKFGSIGKGSYEEREILDLLENEGFQIITKERTPTGLGALCYEGWLFTCVKLKLPLSHPAYFLLLYPFGLIGNLIKGNQTGSELLIKARRDGYEQT
jgi:SAM-dependent methyltransferase